MYKNMWHQQDDWLRVPGTCPHAHKKGPSSKQKTKISLECLRESAGVQQGSIRVPVEHGSQGWKHREECDQGTQPLLLHLPWGVQLGARRCFPLQLLLQAPTSLTTGESHSLMSSHSVVSGLEAAASPGSLLKMQIPRLHLKCTKHPFM